jgi:hypothetical protein
MEVPPKPQKENTQLEIMARVLCPAFQTIAFIGCHCQYIKAVQTGEQNISTG